MKYLFTLLIVGYSIQLWSQDFRNVNWGASAETIKSKETATLKSDESDGNLLYFVDVLGERKVKIAYKLVENKLVRAKYIFIEEHSNNNDYYEDYMQFKKLLAKKYGQPDSDDQNWVVDTYKHDIGYIGTALSRGHVAIVETWNKDKAEIAHAVFGKDKKISHVIEYVSKDYKYLEKKVQDDSAIDDL